MCHIKIPQVRVTKKYYEFSGAIDNHNRQRQEDLEIERYVKVMTWDTRFNHSILGIIVLDSYNFYQRVVHPSRKDRDPHEFISALADEMIDNTIDFAPSSCTRNSNRQTAEPVWAEDVPHQTPTKLMRKLEPTKCCQGRCREKGCNNMCSQVCSACTTMFTQYWICAQRTNRSCWSRHYNNVHAGARISVSDSGELFGSC